MSDMAFHALGAKVRAARRAADLAFIICNETQALAPYRQAALVGYFGARRTRLVAHSGLADVEADSPYALWLAELAEHLRPQLDALPPAARVLALSPAMLPPALAASWADWLPDHVWVLPLAGPDDHAHALLLLARETPWPSDFDSQAPEYLLLQAAGMYGHAWWALTARRRSIGTLWRSLWARKALRWSLVLLPLVLLIPVREYALVQAEVISLRSQVIASPRDGVIKRMVVPPNTPVEAGQIIAELDDTTLFNRLAVAQAALSSARLELHQASQRAIESQSAKAELNLADGKLREREVDVDALQREVAQLSIKAPAKGVFVYSDPDDWAGRPVQTGERVGLLADPASLGVQAWAPVNEAVNLAIGAPMTLFMRVAPLDPVAAQLDYAGYQAVEAPNGVASYQLRGHLEAASTVARIGLRGTARISGDWTVLGYLMFRRPFSAAREWCGC
ncbi:biotin/lipoyl-binding protein [Variovorax sp. J22G21]|uniref:efflux RND transporter periplasmic adaptor subunit n=1 Tax=Variovorax fucosicus TaxID=3053517 RepID=UPI0025765F46|nr:MULTISPECIES: biotin/lipoyl-binding protein [unclassified Variovorax]MDM0041163.1 biotin/lipoyl-binding protein [Variovorax sp. J22R193]MDM0060220.1 biotin/lipoyl-binding protein [Variovorax sp. J22G21]